MLTSARETGSYQVSSFLHDADNISGCFECDSSSNMCFGCSKEPSHRNGETVLLSTQDKCLLLRNQVICHLRILIWRSGYFFSCTFSKENIAMKTADCRSSFLSPDPKRIGGYSDQPGVRPSVRLSVCPSVCPSVDKSLCAQ